MDAKIPTPIIDKNGRYTTVHKNPSRLDEIKSRIKSLDVVPVSVPVEEFNVSADENIDRGSLPSQEYTIAPENFEKFKHIIEKANRRLAKAQIEERFTYILNNETIATGDGTYREVITAVLTKPVIKYNGWSFGAAHEFTPSGEVLSYWSKESDDYQAPEDSHCDQCGVNRHREKVYTLIHDDGETKQVGYNCLSLFLGVSPSGLWTLSDNKIEDELSGLESGYGPYHQILYDSDNVIAAALLSSNHGEEFVPKYRGSKALPSTVERATDLLNSMHAGEKLGNGGLEDEIKEIREFVANMPSDSDYASNLKAVFAEPKDDAPSLVKSKHLGIAVSVVSAWKRSKTVQEKKEQNPIKQEWFGTPGERYKESKTFFVDKRIPLEGAYGTTYLMVMRDEENRLFTWNASNPPRVYAGGQMTLKGFGIKDHKIYNDDHQTQMTRATVENVDNVGNLPDYELWPAFRDFTADLPQEEVLKYEDEMEALNDENLEKEYIRKLIQK